MLFCEIHIKDHKGRNIGCFRISGDAMHLIYEYLKESVLTDGKHPLNMREFEMFRGLFDFVDSKIAEWGEKK